MLRIRKRVRPDDCSKEKQVVKIFFSENANEGVLSRVNSQKLESRQATVESLQMDEEEEEKEPDEEGYRSAYPSNIYKVKKYLNYRR